MQLHAYTESIPFSNANMQSRGKLLILARIENNQKKNHPNNEYEHVQFR